MENYTGFLIKNGDNITVCFIPKNMVSNELSAQKHYYTKILNNWERSRMEKYQYIAVKGNIDFKN